MFPTYSKVQCAICFKFTHTQDQVSFTCRVFTNLHLIRAKYTYLPFIKTRHHSDCDNLGGAHLRNIPNKTQFWSNLNPKYAWMCILIWQYWAKGYLFYQSECILTKRKKMWVCAYLITCSFNFFCRVSLNSFIKAFFMQLSGTSIDSNLFHI